MPQPVFEVEGLTHIYRTRPVLEDVRLRIEAESVCCLVGPNGGGKTTLLRLMAGLLRPTRGHVRAWGQPPERVRARMGYMPQVAAFNPSFPASIEDIVRTGTMRGNAWGGYRRGQRHRALDLLERLDLSHLRDAHWEELSGGEQQRVLAARALAGEPEVLLLDEPTAMVDTHQESRLIETLLELRARLTLVVVSHDLHLVHRLVDRVFCVERHVREHPLHRLEGSGLGQLFGEGLQAVAHRDDAAPGAAES